MDRRFIYAIILMMVIAIVPSFIFDSPPPPDAGNEQPVATPDTFATPVAPQPQAQIGAPTTPLPREAVEEDTASSAADTVYAATDLYRFGVSTRGGRLVRATLRDYRSMAAGDKDEPVQLMLPGSNFLGLKLQVGDDTLDLTGWHFTASTLEPVPGEPVVLTASRGGVVVTLRYTFAPDDYRIMVEGEISGVGPNGGTLLIGMGPGLKNTEADSANNFHELAIVTAQDGTSSHSLTDLDPGVTTFPGPFDWVALKSKYFVAAVFAGDSTSPRIGAVTAIPPAMEDPTVADIQVSLPVTGNGQFSYMMYAGPMEGPRLAEIGQGFDDVDPYGWPGFRTIIRPVAVGVRWLLVWMHENLNLAYGWVLVLFGIGIRVILWPLNQKAMRSSMAMQAIQPQLKEVQEKYKDNPQVMQKKVFEIYKENHVNPLGGCWPVLLPMPVLFALFFVFESTIELRGADFLWLTDLSRPDPYYIIPLLMGASMYVLNKVGQMGMDPNPQMKIMLYVMPVFMVVLFANFASGLNLYYTVSNIVSIPQQWYLARERLAVKGKPLVKQRK